MRNETYKVGSKAKVKTTVHGTTLSKDDIVEITMVHPNEPMYNIKVVKSKRCRSRGSLSAYSYEISPAWKNWKEKAKYVREDLDILKDEVKEIEQELEVLEKYKDEEDYLAHKLVDILKNKSDVEGIKVILKAYKTDLL